MTSWSLKQLLRSSEILPHNETLFGRAVALYGRNDSAAANVSSLLLNETHWLAVCAKSSLGMVYKCLDGKNECNVVALEGRIYMFEWSPLHSQWSLQQRLTVAYSNSGLGRADDLTSIALSNGYLVGTNPYAVAHASHGNDIPAVGM